MPTYDIRFLKPDDSCAESVISHDFASDAEVSDFVRAHYGRKALEVWQGKRRVTRRVSGAHDARAKGVWPQSCRYAALSQWSLQGCERRYGPLPFAEFERLGQASQSVLKALQAGLSRHPVWIRAQDHPAAPPTTPSIRVSFHPAHRAADQWVGHTALGVFAAAQDGPAIVEDLVDAASSVLTACHLTVPELTAQAPSRPKPIVTVGAQISGGLDCEWSLGLAATPAA